jgi:hypothetical protein
MRLLSLLVALSASALVPASAQAEKLETLVLTETSPKTTSSQPAGSTTPKVIGRGDGVITTGIGFGPRRSSPIAGALNPNNEVAIYTTADCSGAPTAIGTLGQLEGAGIQVEVVADSTTTFYATESDPGHVLEVSDCSSPGLTYWHSSSAPSEPPPSGEEPPSTPSPQSGGSGDSPSPNAPVAPRLRVIPTGPANDNTPKLIGSSPGAESVKLFANSSCSGTPIAKASPAELAFGVELRVADNSATDFAGIAVTNGKQSFCSPPATYIEDSTPPRTRITMGPGAKTRQRKVVFRFTDANGDPVGTSFVCKVDHGRWKPCSSPLKLRRLSYRRHTLRVRGTDAIGNAEAKAAKRSFKVIH